MTSLAIIGGGIAGRSLIYTLAKEQKGYQKITLFHSETFTKPCSLNSTAIVAPRGLTRGHSPLGDLLLESFEEFSDHIETSHPEGVTKIVQYTGARDNLETFRNRYPHTTLMKELFKVDTFVSRDEAFLITPEIYNEWLLTEAKLLLGDKLEVINDFVIEVTQDTGVKLKTQNGAVFEYDKLVVAAGSYNRFWNGQSELKKLKTIKTVQGSFLEFDNVDLLRPSFSLTYEGDNLIWNAHHRRLLIGSTSKEVGHELSCEVLLLDIYKRISEVVSFPLPPFPLGHIKVGLREKAQKRMPYFEADGNIIFLGGYYKNGYSLALKMARSLSHQHL